MVTTSYSLLERLRQPVADRMSWDRFVALYTELLYRWARGWGLQPADASDVVQEALLVILRELPFYQPSPNCRFRSWLWAIVRNRFRSFQRKRLPNFQLDQMEDDLAIPDPLTELEIAEEQALLMRRAAELIRADFQPTTWRAFWQTTVEGRNVKEVALELDMSVRAVYAARLRVQQRVREELAGFFD